MAEKVVPTRRRGRASNQTMGHITNASRAIGQQRTNRTHQATIAMSAFMTRIVLAIGAGRVADPLR